MHKENKDDKVMYFGLGGHPGINVPLEQGKKFEDYSLCFDKAGDTKQVMFNDKCFRTGEVVDIKEFERRVLSGELNY